MSKTKMTGFYILSFLMGAVPASFSDASPDIISAVDDHQEGTLRGYKDKLTDKPDDLHSLDPKLMECLLSASSSYDCGTAVAGCIWCKEPIAGLCVTETAAKRMSMMPFFDCNLSTISSEV